LVFHADPAFGKCEIASRLPEAGGKDRLNLMRERIAGIGRNHQREWDLSVLLSDCCR